MAILTKKAISMELLLVIYSFAKSFWLGVFVLTYVLYTKDKYKIIKSQLDACLAESKNEKPKVLEFNCTPDYIYPYKRCVVQQYGRWFIIMKPSREKLNKLFNSLKEAKKEIDIVSPFLPKPKRK